jgi:polyisoprenoid-binding protein YceI
MSTWIFESGHTAAEFRAPHMMVAWVRGLFNDIHGRLELDCDRCLDATFDGEIDATRIWTGQPQRDEHLRSSDFSGTLRGSPSRRSAECGGAASRTRAAPAGR